jgi:[ribosomal protein S18]-alanine N-acetyltransferase
MSPDARKIEIRPVMLADVKLIADLAETLKTAPQWLPEQYESLLRVNKTRPRIVLVAAEPGGGQVVGFAIASLVAPEAELESIAVAAESQRRGVGRRLLQALIAKLRQADVEELLLEVRASNAAAIGLYTALGFRQIGVRPRYYADNDEDAVLMILPLG